MILIKNKHYKVFQEFGFIYDLLVVLKSHKITNLLLT